MVAGKELVSLKEVRKSYKLTWGELEVLKGINLVINQGDFISIVGPSGSGKSTFLNILGLLDKPTGGTFVLDGTEVSTLNDDQLSRFRNKSIGFIFQSFNLFPQLTALENVEVPLIYAGKSVSERRDRSMHLLERVGLRERADHKPSQLSGGEMQRVAIARSLANNPSFLLGDEPTGNLDEHTGDRIVDLMRELNSEGITIVLVTHNPEVAGVTEKIYRLKEGHLLLEN